MELVYPKILYIGLPILAVILIFYFKRPEKYKKGKKVSGASILEDSKEYKRMVIKYKVYGILMNVILVASIIVTMIIAARPHRVKVVSEDRVNRDIILCLDVSDSTDEMNLAMCDEFKEMVKKLEGERIGITIFNSRSVTLVPLTTDYDYVNDILDRLHTSFQASMNWDSDNNYENNFKYFGTITYDGNSSLIGDGLASALYSFVDMEEDPDRCRIIIFVTDNDLCGEPVLTTSEAAALCKKNNVKVFALAPAFWVTDADTFRSAMISTGGGYYSGTGKVDELVSDVKKTNATAISETKTYIIDEPEKWIICLIILVAAYYVIGRRIKI